MPIGEFFRANAPGLVAAGLSVGFAGYMIVTGGSGDYGMPAETILVRHAPVASPLSQPPKHRIVPKNRLLPDRPLFVDDVITGSVDAAPHSPAGNGADAAAGDGKAKGEGRRVTERRPGEEPLPRYVLRFASPAMALVEGDGRLWNVEPGDELPGLGRVEAIERENGRWRLRVSDGATTHYVREE